MKKLKRQYQANVRCAFIYGYAWEIYPSIRSVVHKRFSTKQEKSYYFLHQIECKGYPVKLRAARGKALADPWDDYPSSACDKAKSWKHNSKRRNQYYKQTGANMTAENGDKIERCSRS